MQFPDNYPQHFYQDDSAYILTDAVFGGLGLVPSIFKTSSHKINPSDEYIYVEKVNNPSIFRVLAQLCSQINFRALRPHTAIDRQKK